ncbi:MAG: hypothetical protein FJ304_22325, partial [Planctomycetes bacterium]|nr:hypothetical protein [Planctomycetota bacterium]
MRVTPSGSSPPPRSYGPASWPVGFRGIGGHLLRSAPPVAPLPPAPPAPPVPAAHGSFLLAPILLNTDGHAVAPCPVCMSDARVPAGATWHELRCRSCGTEYVATDGSPPPAPAGADPAPS